MAARNIIAIWLRYENMIAIYRWLGSKYCLWNNINDGEYLFMSAEMSDLLKIRFFYGPGRVQMCETGADLSEFAYIDVDLPSPQTWSISEVKNWVTESLGLDSQT